MESSVTCKTVNKDGHVSFKHRPAQGFSFALHTNTSIKTRVGVTRVSSTCFSVFWSLWPRFYLTDWLLIFDVINLCNWLDGHFALDQVGQI